MEQPLTKAQAAQIIQKLAAPDCCDFSVFYRPHCKERMRQRNVDARDALRVLRTGEVSKAYMRDQEWRHAVKANGLVLAVAIVEGADGSLALHAVTLWRKR